MRVIPVPLSEVFHELSGHGILITAGRVNTRPEGSRDAAAVQSEYRMLEESMTGGESLVWAVNIGEQLLKNGAEISRVEDTVGRICVAYGARQQHVFCVASCLIVTILDKDGNWQTQTRRIREFQTDMDKLDKINNLSRQICSHQLTPEETEARFEEIIRGPSYGIGARTKPMATATAVTMASLKCMSPVSMSPLIRSRKELVRSTPGIRSMMFPINILSRFSPRPHRHMKMARPPQKKELMILANTRLMWMLLRPNVARCRIPPTTAAAAASHRLPPKNRVKEEAISAHIRHLAPMP